MGLIRWIIGGLIGGALGAAVWVAVAYFTEYEVGWIAWGIGFVVGAGVRYGANSGGEDESASQGVVAALIAIGSIVAAKYALFCMFTGGADLEQLRAIASRIHTDEEAMIATMADEVVEARMKSSKAVAWPPGKSYEDAIRQADYPADVWQDGHRKWLEVPKAEQQRLLTERIQAVAEIQQALRNGDPKFGSFFSPWDLLWFGLATVTAFRVGEGSYGGD